VGAFTNEDGAGGEKMRAGSAGTLAIISIKEFITIDKAAPLWYDGKVG
jgi:hypothetical protein